MGRRQITKSILDSVAEQLHSESPMLFGSRPWELDLQDQDEIWLKLVNDCGLDEQNREMRKLLTLVYAPIFEMIGKKLPILSPILAAGLTTFYVPTQEQVVERMQERMRQLMDPCGNLWGDIALDIFRRSSLSLNHMYFVCFYSLLALETFCVDDHSEFILDDPHPTPPNPQQPPKPTKQTPEADSHAAPIIEPIEETGVRFADIGGYQSVREQFMELAAMVNQPGVIQRWGADVPRGVLLNGPPGVGKSYWAHAFASEVSKPFYEPTRQQITSCYVNESAKWMEAMFAQVREAGGGVIFLDEVDGILSSRNQRTFGEDHKVITALNQALQRPETPDDILILMATNRKDLLDSATIRAERIDMIIEFHNPGPDDRYEVFKARCNKAERKAGRQIFERQLTKELITSMNGFSCADISEVVRRVIARRVKQDLAGESDSLIASVDLLLVIEEYRKERFAKAKPHIGFGR